MPWRTSRPPRRCVVGDQGTTPRARPGSLASGRASTVPPPASLTARRHPLVALYHLEQRGWHHLLDRGWSDKPWADDEVLCEVSRLIKDEVLFGMTHLVLNGDTTVLIHHQDGALSLDFCSPRIAQGTWLCVLVHDAASFVSRVATAGVCLAFSAHLPFMFWCAGGFMYLKFASEVSASLAGLRIRLTGF